MTQHDPIPAGTAVFEALPITPVIGAEIRGLRLSADLPAPVVDQLKTLIARHKVVFFHD